MGNQARLWRVIVTASAVALAVGSTSISTRAQAHSLGNGIGTGYHAAPGVADEGSSINSADPTDEGSIVIECVAWAGMRNGETAEKAFTCVWRACRSVRSGPRSAGRGNTSRFRRATSALKPAANVIAGNLIRTERRNMSSPD